LNPESYGWEMLQEVFMKRKKAVAKKKTHQELSPQHTKQIRGGATLGGGEVSKERYDPEVGAVTSKKIPRGYKR
jgi:hypothetical protein